MDVDARWLDLIICRRWLNRQPAAACQPPSYVSI
jgi:hypothetical protein